MTIWWAVAATCAACYMLKLAGLSAPRRILDHPGVQRFAALVPVALLAALIAVQSFAHGQELHVDWPRTAGLGAAVVALLARAPFLVVLAVAAVVTAATRYLLG
ncbi:branched-subunit amino acid transport protein [Streptosporangium becharense]|uniref:Branched-subunit amino acid transport protein n=1 Tax=Streptosporangium becharense TaxID=1816182 RepID=A0A7W9ICR5_9ACTN|nr:AzlD domain-containing protein [Streptosporangium becharense]MBB2912877.1 branched-subunit amino acid transport protein [Streptosporangium becharense]MBB5818298.1 branched-subunit amino acid transport protein [Streptosporangium becharense]